MRVSAVSICCFFFSRSDSKVLTFAPRSVSLCRISFTASPSTKVIGHEGYASEEGTGSVNGIMKIPNCFHC